MPPANKAEEIRDAFHRRAESDRTREDFIESFLTALTEAWGRYGFQVERPAEKLANLFPSLTEIGGRISIPLDAEQPDGFRLILDYRMSAGIIGNLDAPRFLIQQVGFGRATGAEIAYNPRDWEYEKDLVGTPEQRAADVATWLLDNYRVILLSGENR